MDNEFATNARIDGLIQIMKDMQQQLDSQQKTLSLMKESINGHSAEINNLSLSIDIVSNSLGSI